MSDCDCKGPVCRLSTPEQLQQFAAAIKAIYDAGLKRPPKCSVCGKRSAVTSVWVDQLPRPQKYRAMAKGDIIHFCGQCWKEARSKIPKSQQDESDTEALF